MTRGQMGFDFETSKAVETPAAQESANAIPETNTATAPSNEPTVYSVSDINAAIKMSLEGEFGRIWLRGEISNFKPHTSGHFYFSLKDEGAQINAVMFKAHNSKLKFRPENGMEVLVRGKITVYEPRGQYQIFCESMEPAGIGALQKAFEQLKAKLQAEGLFDQARKRPIPTLPKHIGLVTSPTGAALQDMLNVLRRRYRAAHITVVPAIVQGEAAPTSMVNALALINKAKGVDVLIVGRGGGSIEDLWAFNDERVARAIAASRIPVISAVGHEVDFTIADFVADLRAPTPSAAAELVAKSATEMLEKIEGLSTRLMQAQRTYLRHISERVLALTKLLVDPQRRLQDLQLRCDELSLRLENAIFRYIEDRRLNVRLALQKLGSPRETLYKLQKRYQIASVRLNGAVQNITEKKLARLKECAGRLEAMSPLRVVERGYSIVQAKGVVVKSTRQVAIDEVLDIRLAEGELQVKVVFKK